MKRLGFKVLQASKHTVRETAAGLHADFLPTPQHLLQRGAFYTCAILGTACHVSTYNNRQKECAASQKLNGVTAVCSVKQPVEVTFTKLPCALNFYTRPVKGRVWY